MDKPLFQHDCSHCVFLGHHEDRDLYFCPQGKMPTVLARWGDNGPDYESGLFAARINKAEGHQTAMVEALDRAEERGLL